MRTKFLTIFLFINILCFSQPKAEKELLKVDTEFAKLSHEKGVRTAFDNYLAENVTTLPFKMEALKDRTKILENYSKLKTLDWVPLKAEVSKSNDLGYTYGIGKATYEADGKTQTSYSHYISIWKRDKKGNWKLILDTGNDCSEEVAKKYFE